MIQKSTVPHVITIFPVTLLAVVWGMVIGDMASHSLQITFLNWPVYRDPQNDTLPRSALRESGGVPQG